MVKDIILDEDNDLTINSLGDFTINDSDQQHVILLINTSFGQWKQFPFCGLGIIRYLNGSGQQQSLRRAITVHLTADGYNVKDVVFRAGELYNIDAFRNE
jgi:hypothetical protein